MVRADREAALLVDEQRAREGGEEARAREREQRGVAAADPERLGRALVLPDGDERAPRARAAESDDDEVGEQQPAEADVVEARLAREVEAEEVGARDALGGQPVECRALTEEAPVQEPRRCREREREARHGEREPPPAQRREPDEQRDRRAGQTTQDDGRHQIEPEA